MADDKRQMLEPGSTKAAAAVIVDGKVSRTIVAWYLNEAIHPRWQYGNGKTIIRLNGAAEIDPKTNSVLVKEGWAYDEKATPRFKPVV